MNVEVLLFKRDKVELPPAVIELYTKVGTERLDVPPELLHKMLENDDVAQSWILSIASSFKDRADFVLARIRLDHSEVDIGCYTREKPASYYMISPKIAKLVRIKYIPLGNAEHSDVARELTVNASNDSSTMIVYEPPTEYYIFESVIVPKADGVLIFEHEYGASAIDLSEIRSRLASSRATESAKSKSSSRKRRKKSRKKKSSTKKRVASAK